MGDDLAFVWFGWRARRTGVICFSLLVLFKILAVVRDGRVLDKQCLSRQHVMSLLLCVVLS